jgi:hypothetical protein
MEYYLLGGHISEVKKLIAANKIEDNEIAFFYAQAGYVREVNKLIEQGASPDVAALGYVQGQYSNGAYNLLYLLTMTNDKKLCELIITKKGYEIQPMISLMPRMETPDNMRRIYKIASKLKQLIQENALDFNQAQAYLEFGANIWFLQGLQLTKQNDLPVLPLELFLHITCFLTGMTIEDNYKLIVAAHQRVGRSNLNKDDDVRPPKIEDNQIKENRFSFFENKKMSKQADNPAEQQQFDNVF